MRQTTLSYCAELIRMQDRDRYLCALFAPAEVREAWFAIFAFHYEIASIAGKMGEEMVGFVRYAWWRETLTSIYDGKPPRGHPVAEALAMVLKRHVLSKAYFEQIIDGHEKALVEKEALDEAFLESTAGPLMQLCAEAADAKDAGELGVAWGAMEAARLPTMDAEHRAYFAGIAKARLASPSPAVLRPFAVAVAFYLKRLAKGNVRPSAVLLPFTLWLKSI